MRRTSSTCRRLVLRGFGVLSAVAALSVATPAFGQLPEPHIPDIQPAQRAARPVRPHRAPPAARQGSRRLLRHPLGRQGRGPPPQQHQERRALRAFLEGGLHGVRVSLLPREPRQEHAPSGLQAGALLLAPGPERVPPVQAGRLVLRGRLLRPHLRPRPARPRRRPLSLAQLHAESTEGADSPFGSSSSLTPATSPSIGSSIERARQLLATGAPRVAFGGSRAHRGLESGEG